MVEMREGGREGGSLAVGIPMVGVRLARTLGAWGGGLFPERGL